MMELGVEAGKERRDNLCTALEEELLTCTRPTLHLPSAFRTVANALRTVWCKLLDVVADADCGSHFDGAFDI